MLGTATIQPKAFRSKKEGVGRRWTLVCDGQRKPMQTGRSQARVAAWVTVGGGLRRQSRLDPETARAFSRPEPQLATLLPSSSPGLNQCLWQEEAPPAHLQETSPSNHTPSADGQGRDVGLRPVRPPAAARQLPADSEGSKCACATLALLFHVSAGRPPQLPDRATSIPDPLSSSCQRGQ